jgi:hypothetical protein
MKLNSYLSDADHILPGQQVGPHLRLGTEDKLDHMYVKPDTGKLKPHAFILCAESVHQYRTVPYLYTSIPYMVPDSVR